MCVVCGCANTAPANAGHGPDHEHVHPHEHEHEHEHEHAAVEAGSGDMHYGAGPARVSVPGISQARAIRRAIRLEQNVLEENNRHAGRNRLGFAERGVLALNLVSSPGSGKTTLLCATIAALRSRASELPVAVIEGDQQTSLDADRIRATGAAAIQINTGKGCHLDAHMVGAALTRLYSGAVADEGGVLFIENVGNLVCPALWDLGEAAKVVILSVTEGEDKPLKYPDMFGAARLMVLNKTDLLPHLQFDVARCIAYARRVNPRIEVLQLSAIGGAGMDAWLDWIMAAHGGAHQARADGNAHSKLPALDPLALINPLAAPEAELAARIAALEAELAALKGQAA